MRYPEAGGVLHTGPATFFGLLYETTPPEGTRIAFVGVPWDEGNGGRNGANYGPRAVRDASNWFTSYDYRRKIDVWDCLPAVDAGDISVVPADSAQTIDRVAASVEALCRQGIVPYFIGGNHAITIGTAAGAARALSGKKMGYLSIDTHLDTAPGWGGSSYASGCPTNRAANLPNVDGANVVVYGIHGWLNAREHFDIADQFGMRWYGVEEIRERGIAESLAEAIAIARKGVDGLYITFDMDSIDSSSAPGGGTPEADGFTGREAIQIARMLGAARPMALDIVEIAPMYELSGATPRLACNIIMETLSALAASESA
jgi:arginase family enzyme